MTNTPALRKVTLESNSKDSADRLLRHFGVDRNSDPAPVAAPASLSGIADLIEALTAAECAGADPRTIGRLEGQIASTTCESLDDARLKVEFALASLSTRPGNEIEVESLRTAADFLKGAR